MSPVFLTAKWKWLAMLNYEVGPEVLAPLIPRGVELDSFEGRTLVSIVGFLFEGTRIKGIAAPFHQQFEEVNLRFYVRRRRPEGWVRGVVFVKEIVPKVLVAAIANFVYHERYVAMPMRHAVNGLDARYEFQSGERWNAIAVKAAGDVYMPKAGSEEEFITEHYWGYAAQPDGSTMEYQVTHKQWPVWRAAEAVFDGDAAAHYGDAFANHLKGPPSSAFLAEGSEIAIMTGQKLNL